MLEFLKTKHFLFLCLNLKMGGEPNVSILQIYFIHLKIILPYINKQENAWDILGRGGLRMN